MHMIAVNPDIMVFTETKLEKKTRPWLYLMLINNKWSTATNKNGGTIIKALLWQQTVYLHT